MANKKMWDTLDEWEGRKESSYENMQKERVRQGYKRITQPKSPLTTGSKQLTKRSKLASS